MKRIIQLSFLLALLVCLGGCAASPHVRRANLRKLRAELDKALDSKKVSISFRETSLSEVLVFLADLTEIDFALHLGPEDIDPLIDIRANGMTLRNALHWIATLSGTQWVVRDEAVHFIPEDPFRTRTKMKVKVEEVAYPTDLYDVLDMYDLLGDDPVREYHGGGS